MTHPFLEKLDWKDFERLCADLLEAEGFLIESEPFVDRTGADIIAVETYQSHDPNRHLRVRWRVQCKHYANSGNNLGRKEVEESLYNYAAARGPNDGLFLIVSTDYTEAAKEVIDRHTKTNPEAKVTLWNRRQLATRLERHSHLLARYDLPRPDVNYLSALSSLRSLGSVKTLLISDQSAMAHNLTSGLRAAGFDLTFLPFWNYTDHVRLDLNAHTSLMDEYRLVICFLGDSFGLPLPAILLETIVRAHAQGAGLLLFPFFGWSFNRGLYSSLRKIIPVRLQDPAKASSDFTVKRVAGAYRHGDFRWLLAFDSFAEDQYAEFDPAHGQQPFISGIESLFGLSHSFEYLTTNDESKIVWKDTSGNPFVVVNESGNGKVCYLNTCGHSCMALIPVSSPLEVAPQFGRLITNIITWLLN
jgi:hypothetical protein